MSGERNEHDFFITIIIINLYFCRSIFSKLGYQSFIMRKIRVYRTTDLTDLIELEEHIQEIIAPDVHAAIGNLWEIEFRPFITIGNQKTWDVYIDGPNMSVSEFMQVQDIITEKLAREFQFIGREIEYTGMEFAYIFNYGILQNHLPIMNFLPDSYFRELPIHVLYAAICD